MGAGRLGLETLYASLCLLIYLTPTLKPDAVCPVHLHTQTVHSFKGYLAPASGQAVFQVWGQL